MLNASSRGGRVVAATFALLLVTAALGPFVVGTVSAATTYEDTIGGSPRFVEIDTGDMSGGDYTAEVYVPSSEIPDPSKRDNGNWTILASKQLNTGSDRDNAAFYNYGAYSEIRLRVVATDAVSGTPTFRTGTDVLDTRTMLGGTGGDADLTCDFSEQTGEFLDPISQYNVDCQGTPEPPAYNTSASQDDVQLEMYQDALTLNEAAETSITVRNNYLNDTQTVALIEGKNAYIRALNNGSTKAVAETEAKEAIRDYYAVKQVNLINEWNRRVIELRSIVDAGYNHSSISMTVDYSDDPNNPADKPSAQVFMPAGDQIDSLDNQRNDNTTLTLVNNSDVSVERFWAGRWISDVDGGIWNYDSSDNDEGSYIGITTGASYSGATSVMVHGPDGTYNATEFMNLTDYKDTLQSIQSKEDTAVAEMDTFVNGTYDAYQQGEINNSDLIDPFTLFREYAPNEDFQSWALSTFQNIGVDAPRNLSTVGHMTVVDNETNTTYRGILMSDGLPQNDTFRVGETYDAEQLVGQQFVVTSDERHDLSGNFTLLEAVSMDGTNLTNVTYKNVTYQTTSIDGYNETLQRITQNQQEIQERLSQQNSGGGGGSLPFGVSQESGIAILALAGGGLYLFGQNRAN